MTDENHREIIKNSKPACHKAQTTRGVKNGQTSKFIQNFKPYDGEHLKSQDAN
jgi:hypothetical protein